MTAADHALRRRGARGAAQSVGAAALLVTDRTNVAYLTGFTGSNGCLLLMPDAEVLVTDGRYVDQAAHQCPDVEVTLDRDTQRGAVRLALADSSTPVALEADHITLSDYRRLERLAGPERLMATSGIVERLRRVKDDFEVACLTRACDLVQQALAQVLPTVRAGQTERRLATALERAMVDLGADSPAFETIVASGPNSAIPHHSPTDRPLAAGDLLKIDAGAGYRGYHSDMTRTYVVAADPDPRQRQMHAAVESAAAAARAELGSGVAASAPDSAARAELGGWVDRFTHGLGHGVGLQIHEAPLLSARSADTIGRADVLTVEPGVYLPGFGGVRIEDTLLVTETGSRCLTTAPRDLITLG